MLQRIQRINMTNTREQLLIARIAELEAENQALRARIAELEQQVSKLLVTPTSLHPTKVLGAFAA